MRYKIFALLSVVLPIVVLILVISNTVSLEKKLVLNKGILTESKKK